MAKDNKEDTISKSLLLNWLSVSDENIPVSDLGSWIEAKTNGNSILETNFCSQIYKELPTVSMASLYSCLCCTGM